jgi:hypothetical protein
VKPWEVDAKAEMIIGSGVEKAVRSHERNKAALLVSEEKAGRGERSKEEKQENEATGCRKFKFEALCVAEVG